MGFIPNPVGDITKRVDETLESVDVVLEHISTQI